MKYASKSWLSREYINEFKKLTGVDKLEQEEEDFIINFFDISSNSLSKTTYYESIYRYRRGFPKFFILFFIKRTFKNAFILQKAPKSLIKISDKLAEKMAYDAMKFYCRISD